MDLEQLKNEQGVLLDVISNKVLRIQQLTAEVNSAIVELSNDHNQLWETIEEKLNAKTDLGKEESRTAGEAEDIQREASSQIIYNETGQEHC